jgi:N utilization substance protein A
MSTRGVLVKTVAKKTKKKTVRAKKAAGKKKVTLPRKAARPKKAARAKTPIRRNKTTRRPVVRREISSGSERSSLGSGPFETSERPTKRGLGTGAAGQSGDLQGLSRTIDVDSESVEELVEEGQAFEADAISGVENAPDADQGEVRVHERPEDELPLEDPEDR